MQAATRLQAVQQEDDLRVQPSSSGGAFTHQQLPPPRSPSLSNRASAFGAGHSSSESLFRPSLPPAAAQHAHHVQRSSLGPGCVTPPEHTLLSSLPPKPSAGVLGPNLGVGDGALYRDTRDRGSTSPPEFDSSMQVQGSGIGPCTGIPGTEAPLAYLNDRLLGLDFPYVSQQLLRGSVLGCTEIETRCTCDQLQGGTSSGDTRPSSKLLEWTSDFNCRGFCHWGSAAVGKHSSGEVQQWPLGKHSSGEAQQWGGTIVAIREAQQWGSTAVGRYNSGHWGSTAVGKRNSGHWGGITVATGEAQQWGSTTVGTNRRVEKIL
eukprot:314688-Pelagomonas_calceolata.AAC.4